MQFLTATGSTTTSTGRSRHPSLSRHQAIQGRQIARPTSRIPEKGARLVHYYGAYSNAHRGIAARREVFGGESAAGEDAQDGDLVPVPDGVVLLVR